MYQLATAPRGIGQVLDSVFRLTRAGFGRMLPYAIASGALSAAPFIYLVVTGVFSDPGLLAGFELSRGYIVMTLLMIPASLLVYAGGVIRMESIAQGRDAGFAGSLGLALPRLLTVFVATVCFMLACAIGLVLLIIPGLILIVSLYLYLPAIVLDDKGAIESLKFSHKLVWGNWWRVATIVTVAFIIMYLIFILAGILFGVFMGAGGMDPASVFLVQMAASVLGGLLVMPFFTALYVEIYRDLKMRKTGGDLAARIASVGTAR